MLTPTELLNKYSVLGSRVNVPRSQLPAQSIFSTQTKGPACVSQELSGGAGGAGAETNSFLNPRTIVIGVIVLAIVAGGVYVFFQYRKRRQLQMQQELQRKQQAQKEEEERLAREREEKERAERAEREAAEKAKEEELAKERQINQRENKGQNEEQDVGLKRVDSFQSDPNFDLLANLS